MQNLKPSDFVFANNGIPLKDTEFMKAFEKYSGEKFYPHIVRSYYATTQAKNFLKTHKKATKKDNKWVNSYNVTVHHYLQPKIFEKIQKLVGK